MPKFIRIGQILNSRNSSTRFCKSSTPVMFSKSAIGQHLLGNPMCAQYYNDKQFTIFSFGRWSFHLSALEAVYIKLSKLNLFLHSSTECKKIILDTLQTSKTSLKHLRIARQKHLFQFLKRSENARTHPEVKQDIE